MLLRFPFPESSTPPPFALDDLTYRMLFSADTGVFSDTAGTTPAADGDHVRRWNFSGTLSDYFDVALDGSRPTLQTGEINGRNCLRFATDDAMKDRNNNAATWKFLHDGSAFSMVIVWRSTSANPGSLQVLMDTSNGASASVGFNLGFDDTGTSSRFDTIDVNIAKGTLGTYRARAVTRREAVKAGAWHVTAIRYDDSLSDDTLRTDNDGHWGGGATGAKSGTASTADPTGYLHLGSRVAGDYFFNGDIAFIAITDGSDTLEDYYNLQHYVADLYGIADLKWFGAPTVIQHDASGDDHNAWPGLCVAANGDLVTVYSKATTHSAFDGNLVCRRSSDEGATWSAEATVFDFDTTGGGTTTWTGAKLTVLADERIVCTVGVRINGDVGQPLGYFISEDHAVTWSSLHTITDGYDVWNAEGGGLVVLANGDWLYPFYGQATGDVGWSCGVLLSSNEGISWTFVNVIDASAAGLFAEMGCVQVSSGRILALARYENTSSTYLSYSDDNGATWLVDLIYVGHGAALLSFLTLQDGGLVALNRFNGVSGSPAVLLYSGDEGTSWQKGYVFEGSPNHTQTNMTYGQLAQTDDGTVIVAYGSEASLVVSDILFAKTALIS